MIVCISGPSGAGKTTVAEALIEQGVFHRMLKSVTTRARRGPLDNEYIFVTPEEFEKVRLAERVEYAGNLYGLPMSEIEEGDNAKEGQVYVVIAESHGMEQIRGHIGNGYLTIFIDAPDDHLAGRLERRGYDAKERLKNLQHDRRDIYAYDYIVPNKDGDLDWTLERVAYLVREWMP